MKVLFTILGLSVTALALIIALRAIWENRSYKTIEGKLFVRHGIFGKWKEVEKHMEEDHKEEQK